MYVGTAKASYISITIRQCNCTGVIVFIEEIVLKWDEGLVVQVLWHLCCVILQSALFPPLQQVEAYPWDSSEE